MAVSRERSKRFDGMVRKWMVDSVKWIGNGLLAIGLLCGCTHEFDNHKNTPSENFEALWQIIDEKYCLFDDKQVDWDSVYAEYQPQFDTMKIVKFGDQYRMFDLMEEMLNTLEDGHVNLYTPFDVSVCSSWYEGYPTNFDSEILTKYYLKDYRRAGGLNYCKIDGDSIGYVYYGSFSDSFTYLNWLMVMNYFAECKGIVLDVRNNGGGSMENAYRLAAPFFSKDTVVGYWQHKSGRRLSLRTPMSPPHSSKRWPVWEPISPLMCRRRWPGPSMSGGILYEQYQDQPCASGP